MRQSIRPPKTLKMNDNAIEVEKISFLSHISHGIRTPLNAIMGFSKLLNFKNNSLSKQKRYIREILKGSNLLLQFVDNVVDLSLLENNKYALNIKKFNVNQLIWDFIEYFYDKKNEEKISDLNLMLVWDDEVKDLEMLSDSFLVKKCLQLLFNIITTRYSEKNFELGYSIYNENMLKIFMRPSNKNLENVQIEKNFFLYDVDTNNSFEMFNYQVLCRSINLLNGDLNLFSEDNEYWFAIPINLNYKIN